MTTKLPSRVQEDLRILYDFPYRILEDGGSFLRIVDDLEGKILLACYDSFSVISVSAANAERIRNHFDESHNYSVSDLQRFWNKLELSSCFSCRIQLNLQSAQFPLPEGYSLKRHDPADHSLLQSFLEHCSPHDIDDAAIDLDDPDDAIILVMKDDTPIAYAGYRIWQKNLGDVGILVLPEHRRMGLGVAAVAEVTRICLERGYVPLYRHDIENLGSAAIATTTGYHEFWKVSVFTVE